MAPQALTAMKYVEFSCHPNHLFTLQLQLPSETIPWGGMESMAKFGGLCFLLFLTFTVCDGRPLGIFPPTCNRIECPSYTVVDSGNGFEIRRINPTKWITTLSIDDISFVEATRSGFLQLFRYIQGQNDKQQKIEMTGPVITEVKPSDGPFCASSFATSFYVPKVNQVNPPSADGLHVQSWGETYVAVRQFSGFVVDDDIGQEAAALYESVAGTAWADAIYKRHGNEGASNYIVAQYNSPFEFTNRVNEIWFTFDWEGLKA